MKRRSAFLIGIFLLATAMLAAPAAAQDCVAPPEGLVSWWPADGNADDVFAGHDGTILGGMGFEPGMVGDAFSGDGVDDHVEVPNTGGVFDFVSQWTLHAWVFPRSESTDRFSDDFFIKTSRVGNLTTFAFKWRSDPAGCPAGTPCFSAQLERASDDRDFGVSSQAHPPARWYHVVGVYDGNDLIIYVDGVEEGRNTIGFVVSYASPDPLSIGSFFSASVFQ